MVETVGLKGDRLRPTTSIGPKYDCFYLKKPTPYYELSNHKLTFTHRAGVITNPRELQEFWNIHDNIFTSKEKSKLFNARWGIRGYGLRFGEVTHNLFQDIHKEHGNYLDIIGDFDIYNNNYIRCSAQGIQVVSRSNHQLPEWGDLTGKISIRQNYIKECGLEIGIGRAAFGLTVFGGNQNVELIENWIENVEQPQWQSGTPPGAINVDDRELVFVRRNVAKYKTTGSRPLARFNNIGTLIIQGGYYEGGDLHIYGCDKVQVNTKGTGKLVVWDGPNKSGQKIHEGPVSEFYSHELTIPKEVKLRRTTLTQLQNAIYNEEN